MKMLWEITHLDGKLQRLIIFFQETNGTRVPRGVECPGCKKAVIPNEAVEVIIPINQLSKP